MLVGFIFSFLTFLTWGLGDFFIQATARKIGVIKSLFFIGFTGFLMFLPFVYKDLGLIFNNSAALIALVSATAVTFFASLFDFEALKEGKISVIEPVIGLELPLTVALAIFFNDERLSALQIILIATVFIGLFLAVTRHRFLAHLKSSAFEKGIVLALVAAFGMALTNFTVGVSSQDVSPVFTIWFIHTVLAILCYLYLVMHGPTNLMQTFKKYPRLILLESILDNLAWVFYALATTHLPISIVVTITESYIVLSAALGIYFNREKLKKHQFLGIVLALIGIIVLAAITKS